MVAWDFVVYSRWGSLFCNWFSSSFLLTLYELEFVHFDIRIQMFYQRVFQRYQIMIASLFCWCIQHLITVIIYRLPHTFEAYWATSRSIDSLTTGGTFAKLNFCSFTLRSFCSGILEVWYWGCDKLEGKSISVKGFNNRTSRHGQLCHFTVSNQKWLGVLKMNPVLERKLRPIYDALDSRNYKKALKLCNNVLKKKEDVQIVSVSNQITLSFSRRYHICSVFDWYSWIGSEGTCSGKTGKIWWRSSNL